MGLQVSANVGLPRVLCHGRGGKRTAEDLSLLVTTDANHTLTTSIADRAMDISIGQYRLARWKVINSTKNPPGAQNVQYSAS